jgi:hypothetical protein
VFFARYYYCDELKEDEMGGSCCTYESGSRQRVLVVKPDGKKSCGRATRRWEDTINIGPKDVGWEARTGFIWLRMGIV